MLLELEKNIELQQLKKLQQQLQDMGFAIAVKNNDSGYAIMVTAGVDKKVDVAAFANLPGVANAITTSGKYKLSAKEHAAGATVIEVGDVKIGGGNFVSMAGPCAIESQQQILKIAAAVATNGAQVLRGGAFKPRTSPYDFQGLGERGLEYMRLAADKNKLLMATEVVSTEDAALVATYADIVQVGARNMQNFALLKALGKINRPVLLKRGSQATYNEFLLAAEYILSAGNSQVILCERGIRTFESYSRNTLDLAAVPILKQLTHLPIIVDPSHATGLREIVTPMAVAATAAGADGIIVEVHYNPDESVSDARQALSVPMFADLMQQVQRVRAAL